MSAQLLDQGSQTLEEASSNIFQLMSEFIGINTFFIAKNDGHTVNVLKTLNRDVSLLEDGFTIDFQDSY